MSDVLVYSDGGSNGDRKAAGAAIVDYRGKRRRFIVYLGQATNNEAEITGSLIGFSFLRLLKDEQRKAVTKIRWICDSEYVLKSGSSYIKQWQANGWRTAAKKPVKNQALWHAFLELTSDFTLSPEHVRGHTGHPENEACDAACNWAITSAETVLQEEGEGPVELALDEEGSGAWYLIDGRDFIERMRLAGDGEPEEDDKLVLVQKLSELSKKQPARKKPEQASVPQTKAPVPQLHELIRDLRSLLAKAEKHDAPPAHKLALTLRKALRDLEGK